MRFAVMDPRRQQLIEIFNHHRVALGGLAIALTLGVTAGNVLKPAGLLEEPMAAQLISGPAQAANSPPPLVLEEFPADAANRPWVAGTDAAKLNELPRLAAYYDDRSYSQTYVDETAPMPLPDSTPSVADHAVDAMAVETLADSPA